MNNNYTGIFKNDINDSNLNKNVTKMEVTAIVS